VTAISLGTAVITATTQDGSKTATCEVTVIVPSVTGVTVEPDSLSFSIGDTAILTAIVTPENADSTVTWSSSAANIATVSATGKVTAISLGTAVITATTRDGSKTATCEVRVRPRSFTWKIDNGVLTISGQCPMPDYVYDYSSAPWYSQRSEITSIVINNGIESIGNFAFMNCSRLTSVTIPNSVTSIGNYAFSNCTGLTSVIVSNSVTSIGEWTFKGCTGLTSVIIPNSVTSIGDFAFYGCTGLTSVTIPNSVTSIGNETFYECSSLTSVTIPNSVTSISSMAFRYCANLADVHVSWSSPSAVTLGGYVFSDIKNGAKLYVPSASLTAYQASSQWTTYFRVISYKL
jgi:hypothetical protein